MLKLTDIDGRNIYIREDKITSIIDKPGFHTNAFVWADGIKYEVKQTAKEIYRQIEESNALRKG